MSSNHSKIIAGTYDIIIIGAGIVGCAMARQFTLEGLSVLTLEKGADILDGASKANSAILHTGFDAPPNSIEQSCIAESYQEYLRVREKLKLPLMETGAVVTAWNEEEEALLEGILQKAHRNGICDAELITAKATLKKEPKLASSVKASVYVPGEYVIDPWTTPYVYMLQAIENGAQLLRSTEVLSGGFDGLVWKLETSRGLVKGETVINCAGLYGDKIDELLLKKTSFEIRPRKGQFLVYDKAASNLLNSIILPVPNEITKGIVVVKTIFGNILVGPTAEEQKSRKDASVDKEILESLRNKGEEILPALVGMPVTATFAGIRPATQFKDYCIKDYEDKRYVSVGGIRSTGLSAALGVAKHVFKLYEKFGKSSIPVSKIVYPKNVLPIAETESRDWKKEGNEGVICHCEWVTQREIKKALTGSMPVGSLAGLKRRTRVSMGRCQGFYCSAKVAELTQDYFDQTTKISDKNDLS